MNVYLLQIVNGIGVGMLYFLLAVGLSIVFGLLRFVNFAHGAFYLLGAYFCYQALQWEANFWVALLLVPLAVGAFAWLVEKLVLRHVYAQAHEFHILVTVGLALVLQECAILVWGPLGDNVAVPASLDGVVIWGSFVYPKYRLFVIGFTAVLAALLWWLLEGTRLGSTVRAGSEAAEMVSLLGINVSRVFSLVFALGAATAALAGVLAAPIRGVDPFMGIEALGVAFVVVVVGGMGNFLGALVGGLLVGIVQSVMSTLWPEGARLMIYVAMAAVLLLRPNGLLGRAA
ncbi:branched-chain amino acid ABC transporter permease [Burkholderia gladioli]|jgi:branched-chain amino acid transport system permease protein|uniref:Branched-chain amino acid ABC transporter permease n=2 Tax=Burkholderia gladioli TaxID=28095 RepID=A0A095F7A7_BURGA|nr:MULTISPECIES: branched-chain amino acid ABC transporter permease [Burkholderia]AEA65361.1 inner-membrane translocator [Burkholderia gladioli BSR3]AJW94266.1 branched-chain amino acid transport system / permease component family protein [Burkholderia gladioli]ASD83541.1 branched-chain amino acid ABC transporter permease [Burkholderia gladioli pv. gladioli]ATF89145.1 branched-chain amino acid ABC transporter permease [Burkholderia gladioli pv. gladioli]AWY50969.1 branched-chain amino acid ABC